VGELMRRVSLVLLQAVVFLFFVAFFITPIVQVLRGGVTDGDGHFTAVYLLEVFRNPLYLTGLLNSLLIAVCTTCVCLLISVPLAWLADRFEFPGKRIFVAGLLLPLILPPFVGALGMQRIFGQYGALNACLVGLGVLAPDRVVDYMATLKMLDGVDEFRKKYPAIKSKPMTWI